MFTMPERIRESVLKQTKRRGISMEIQQRWKYRRGINGNTKKNGHPYDPVCQSIHSSI
jgi:hypothetical protein